MYTLSSWKIDAADVMPGPKQAIAAKTSANESFAIVKNAQDPDGILAETG